MNKLVFNNTVLALLKTTPGLGSVQINKGLIMIDAFHHAHFKKTLTEITYIKHWFGPVPDFAAKDELFRMEFEKIKVVKERIGRVKKHAHYAIQEPDYSSFSPKAIEIIQDVAFFITGKKAGKLSHITHDAVYENTPMGGIIPIESVYNFEADTLPWTSEEKADATKILEEVSDDATIDLSRFYAQV
ncbi:MAG: Panacea domain-containing protein [Spirochaetes bacterium]|nr:Panacea domain-containing protein [Spirochaetota bacterium]